MNHVFVVVEENHSYSQVVGSPNMPYLNSLISRYALAENYYANTHPSIGNYFMMTTGTIATNNDGHTATVFRDNIVRRLTAAGKVWKSYAENLPSPGYIGGNQLPYVCRHNPLSYFSDIRNQPLAQRRLRLVPFAQLAADVVANTLPDFGFIVPNIYSDGHSCPPADPACTNARRLKSTDNWLRARISPLLAHSSFSTPGDGLLIVVFDEAEGDNEHGGGHIACVLIGPDVKQGYRSAVFYQHQSLLRFICQLQGLTTFPGLAASAPDMNEFVVAA